MSRAGRPQRTARTRAALRKAVVALARGARAATAFAPIVFGPGCSESEGILGLMGPRDPDGGAGAAEGGGSASPPRAGGDADSAPRGAACESVPPLLIANEANAQTRQACTTTLAQATFLNALCACNDATFGDMLQTRGFDSTQGPYQPNQPDDSGAAVGVNRAYSMPAGQTDVGGSFALASPTPTPLSGRLLVRGDFRAASDVTVAGVAQIARNAWFGGTFFGLGTLEVGGTLHHEGLVTALTQSSGANVQEPVTVEAPCACAPEDRLAVRALVADAASHNDDPSVPLDPAALRAIAAPTTLTLPCGRYYLEGIGGRGDVTLDVRASAALFVAGSLDLDGSFVVQLAPGAELDLFIAQDLRIGGQAVFGDRARPVATRLYVGGSGDITLPAEFVGNLYAPSARVRTLLPTVVWGSVFAFDFASAASASFVYDRAVVSRPVTCPAAPPPSACERCGWCTGGLACVDGACGACRTDDDCCSQSVCLDGACTLLVDIQ